MKPRHKVDIVGRRYRGGGGWGGGKGVSSGLCSSVLEGNCSPLKRALCPPCNTSTHTHKQNTSVWGQPGSHPMPGPAFHPAKTSPSFSRRGSSPRSWGMLQGPHVRGGARSPSSPGRGRPEATVKGDGDLPKVDLRPGKAACLVCRLCSTLLSKCPAVHEGGMSGVT